MKAAIILFAHGSRDPNWARPFAQIQRRIQTELPDTAVELAFLEFMQPNLEQAATGLIAAGHRLITVAPLFMAQGSHLRNDLARLLDSLRLAHPGIEFAALPAIGEVDGILNSIAQWLVAAATSSRVKAP